MLYPSSDGGISQDLRVLREIAEPRRQIDDASHGRIVQSTIITDGTNCCGPHSNAHTKADRMAGSAPFTGNGLHRDLQVDREPDRLACRLLTCDRGIDEEHDSVSGKADQGCLMTSRNSSNRLIVLAQYGHDNIGFIARRERRESAQIAKDNGDFASLPFEQFGECSTSSATCDGKNCFSLSIRTDFCCEIASSDAISLKRTASCCNSSPLKILMRCSNCPVLIRSTPSSNCLIGPDILCARQ